MSRYKSSIGSKLEDMSQIAERVAEYSELIQPYKANWKEDYKEEYGKYPWQQEILYVFR